MKSEIGVAVHALIFKPWQFNGYVRAYFQPDAHIVAYWEWRLAELLK